LHFIFFYHILLVGKVGQTLQKGEKDMENMIVDNAKVMSKGQITLPKEIRTKLGLSTGDRVTLVCDGDQVVMMNAAVYAMKMLQKGMEGQAYVAGLDTEEAINDLVAEVRGEVEGL
jgi:AbrB family looped-hinge helix DNA binding protein